MRHLALALTIIGAILISAGAISYFIAASVMTGGITALFALGGIAVGLGFIFFIANAVVSARRHRHNV